MELDLNPLASITINNATAGEAKSPEEIIDTCGGAVDYFCIITDHL